MIKKKTGKMRNFTLVLIVALVTGSGMFSQNLELAIISDNEHAYTAKNDVARMIRSIPVGGIRNSSGGGLTVFTEIHGLIIKRDSLGVEISRSYPELNYLMSDRRYDYPKEYVDGVFNQLGISIESGRDSYTDKMKIIYLMLLIQETQIATNAQGEATGLFQGDNFEIYEP